MSDSWELIKKPTQFKDLIDKYLYLVRLRHLRDFSYSYKEAQVNVIYDKSLIEPLISPFQIENGTGDGGNVSYSERLLMDLCMKIRWYLCCGYYSYR